jgi:hypothetical protein
MIDAGSTGPCQEIATGAVPIPSSAWSGHSRGLFVVMATLVSAIRGFSTSVRFQRDWRIPTILAPRGLSRGSVFFAGEQAV